MEKVKNTTAENVSSSVSSIYADLLNRRNAEREARQAAKEQAKEEKRLAREKEEEEGKKLTKKEKRAANEARWEQIIVGLTGEDLEYSSEKKKGKKKYRKWITDEDGSSDALVPKKKKPKKKNYNKEFEAELSMLKAIVADQNRFTNDLQKRFQNAAGPATKDAMPLNKTLVELAAAVNTSRSNALGYLNAISGLKKTIAELYMKQKKLDSDLSGGGLGESSRDLALVGSSLANMMYGDSVPSFPGSDVSTGASVPAPAPATDTPPVNTFEFRGVSISPTASPASGPSIPSFDPATWDGGGVSITAEIQAEDTPHSFVVFKNKETGEITAKAFRDDTGEEFVGCPLPFGDLSKLKLNEESMIARSEFDEVYPLKYI